MCFSLPKVGLHNVRSWVSMRWSNNMLTAKIKWSVIKNQSTIFALDTRLQVIFNATKQMVMFKLKVSSFNNNSCNFNKWNTIILPVVIAVTALVISICRCAFKKIYTRYWFCLVVTCIIVNEVFVPRVNKKLVNLCLRKCTNT